MKRTGVTAIIAFTFMLSSIAGIETLRVAEAYYAPPPSIEILSPIPAPDVHSNASIMLNVRVNVLPKDPDVTFIRYSLDGKANITLTSLAKEDNVWYWTTTKDVFAQGKAFSTEAFLGTLADGNHSLTVYAPYADGKEMSRTREFIVDTNYEPPVWHPPEIVLVSPQNQTYTSTEVSLTFATNETILYANYVLDPLEGNGSQYLTGNVTLTGLSEGMHKLIVTVHTERGMATQSTFFTVAQETETTQLFSSLMMIAIVVAGALVGLGLLVYFKKRKR